MDIGTDIFSDEATRASQNYELECIESDNPDSGWVRVYSAEEEPPSSKKDATV